MNNPPPAPVRFWIHCNPDGGRTYACEVLSENHAGELLARDLESNGRSRRHRGEACRDHRLGETPMTEEAAAHRRRDTMMSDRGEESIASPKQTAHPSVRS